MVSGILRLGPLNQSVASLTARIALLTTFSYPVQGNVGRLGISRATRLVFSSYQVP